MIEPETEIEENPERIEAIQHACNIFADVCRMTPHSAPQNEDDMADLTNEIVRRNLELTDSVSYTVAWHAVRNRREDAARREAEAEAREEARQRDIDDFKRPSAEDRSALLVEMRSRQVQKPTSTPVDLSHLTQEEFDGLPDTELRRALGGTSTRDRQMRTNARTVKEERNELILAGKILNRAGISKPKTVKFSPEELSAQEQRSRAIERDKAERRKLEQAWRKK
jgi:hypothetical protein